MCVQQVIPAFVLALCLTVKQVRLLWLWWWGVTKDDCHGDDVQYLALDGKDDKVTRECWRLRISIMTAISIKVQQWCQSQAGRWVRWRRWVRWGLRCRLWQLRGPKPTARYQITAGLQAEDSVSLTLMRWRHACSLSGEFTFYIRVCVRRCSAATTVTSKADTESRVRCQLWSAAICISFDCSCAHFCINHVCAIYDSWLAYLQMSNIPAPTDPDSWHYTNSLLPLCERLRVCAPVKWIYLCVDLFVCR